MREIKIRAWNGKEFLPLAREVAFIDDEGVLRSKIEGIVFNEFTGLKDKNGKEIFEGDIVNCYNGIAGKYFNSVVEWQITDIQDDISDVPLEVSGFIIGSLSEVEVIGNIYEI